MESRRARAGRGTYNDPNETGPTFAVVAEEWFADRAARGRTPKTLTGYRSILDTHLLPRFGDVPIRVITVGQIEAFERTLIEAGKARGTRNNILRVLGPLLGRAKRLGIVAANPIADLDRERQTVERPKPTTINSTQVELLASVIDPHYAPLVVFTAYTGLRAGEIAALRWGDLEFDWDDPSCQGGWVRVERSASEISVNDASRLGLATVRPGLHVGPPNDRTPLVEPPAMRAGAPVG